MVRRGTYSIVARDPDSLELGVAVQSHWFSVGSVVPFAQAGVGAVAVQSVPDPDTGPAVLETLAARGDAREALRVAVGAQPNAGMRQVGVVDARGDGAAWTGADCIRHAGDVEGPGFAAQANMMLNEGVPEAMAAAFERATGPLAERLVDALDGAEAAGGDVRGRQSAALLVVPAQGPPHAHAVDLRVEDHRDPLGELRRLLVLQRAYELAGEADELVAQGRHEEAGPRYEQAAQLAPDNDELLFWAGLAAGPQRGLLLVREAIERNPRWTTLLERLTDDVAPGAAAMRRALAAD
ncbi:DUF1028 domain-containing protein [Capillimicrobium parvum]|uniref:DUF1028 domain-containing protein n=1 Tax=Capillimicrobium parvum TaxID=2884022 RepID=A0A9E6XTZ8_9ACTN|nr:DUF1028 domain-containing protein [Capillimicrobium parvum]UGS34088.1 hypothetical protein DSM104329_00459 [Capillimicrobium parvum]